MVGITEMELVASYNIVDEVDMKRIVVPGIPPKWIGNEGREVTVKPDVGEKVLDHNALIWPDSPMEPAICAIVKLHPDFDFTKLDIISDRRALATLVELASEGTQTEKLRKKDFSFGVVLAGQTLVFCRSGNVKETCDRFTGCRRGLEKHVLE
jgi:hypothetical protein